MQCVPLYQVIMGFGTPVALQASLTVCPSSAVQFAKISTKSGGPVAVKSSLINAAVHSIRIPYTAVVKSESRNTKVDARKKFICITFFWIISSYSSFCEKNNYNFEFLAG